MTEPAAKENAVTVEVGQVWADCDWRSEGRKVKVVAIEGDRVIVEVIAGTKWRVTPLGTRTKIALRRFKPNSTGYRLITADLPGLETP